MEFNQEELKNLAILLQRVNLTGKEAVAVAQLQVKINSGIKPETTSETTGSKEVGVPPTSTGHAPVLEENA